MSKTTMIIEDIPLHVTFYYSSGRPANRDNEEEYAEVEIESVLIGDIDILCLLSIDVFNLIETKILENRKVEDYE